MKLFKKLAVAVVGAVMALGVGIGVNAGAKGVPAKAGSDSYSITFKKDKGDGSTLSTSTTFSSFVTSGSDKLSSINEATKSYFAGSSGIKLGASGNAGVLDLALSDAGQVEATSIVVHANRYNSSKAVTLSVNGSATQDIKDGFANYTFNSSGTISNIKLSSSKYMWVDSITVNYSTGSAKTIKPISIAVKEGSTDISGTTVNYTDSLNGTKQFNSTVSYETGDSYQNGSKVSWDSSNKTVATVSSTGLVTVLSKGTTTISVETTDATEATDNISASFTLDTTGATFEKGTDISVPLGVEEAISNKDKYLDKDLYILGYICSWYNDNFCYIADSKTDPKDNSKRIEMYLYSGDRVYHDGTEADYVVGTKAIFFGKFTYYSGGNVYEIAKSSKDSKGHVYFQEFESPTSLTIKTNPSTMAYAQGSCFNPTGMVVTLNYESRSVDVSYSQSNASEFTFSPSLDTPLTVNPTVVSVTYGGKTTTVSVVVDTAIHTNTITITKDGETAPDSMNWALNDGDLELGCVLSPSDSADEVTWSSSNEDLAIVIDGTVTFSDDTGEAVITASSGGKSDSITITITDPTDAYVSEIEINQGADVVKEYYKGETEPNLKDLSITATFVSNDVAGWSKQVTNFDQVTWSLDRESGFVVATYNNDDDVYDLFEVTIYDTDRPQIATADILIADIADANSWNDSEKYTNFKSGIISFTASGGGNTGKYYVSDETWRFYQNESATLTITLDDGYELSSITASYSIKDSGKLADADGNKIDSGTKVACSGSSYTFTIDSTSGTKGKVNFTGFVIEYKSTSAGPTAASVAQEIKTMAGGWDNEVETANCSKNYKDAKALVLSLGADELEIFQTSTDTEIVSARATYEHWCDVNGDASPYKSAAAESRRIIANSESTTMIVTIVTIVSASTIAGYFFLRKKKETF